MTTSVLDESPALAELLDIDGFREVCRTFSELYAIGIKVFDADGHKIADTRASTGEHCGYLFTVHPTQVLCTNLVNAIRTSPLAADSSVQTLDCFSGLRYKIVPLVYEGLLVGRLIFGPYAPTSLTSPPEQLKTYEPQLSLQTLAQYQRQIPRADDATIHKVIDHIGKVLGVIIHASYRAQVTAKLHIASIGAAFEDLERSNQALKTANDKLKDLDRLKSNFIATVSHELRTPLTSVIGYSEMLLEGMAGELTAEQRDYVGTILEKGESLLNLIGQVLDLSRIESGNVLMQKALSDPREVIRLALTDVAPQATKRNLRLVTEVASEVEPIWIDPDKIRRVVTNLLGNAVKFTPPQGTVKIMVDLYAVQPNERGRYDIFEPERNRMLRIQVSDTGIGIPEDKLERVFEAFYQVDNSSTREFGGTGLGLSIVRNFVHAHRGRIELKSKVGVGTTFTVFLPYVTEELGAGVQAELASHARSA